MPRPRLPFRGMSPQAWQNLAIAALLLIYAAQISLDLLWGNLFGNLAVDFASFWGAGYAANHQGYAAVYDLGVMSAIQAQFVPAHARALLETRIIPTPFLPIFIVPFQVLALLPPTSAAVPWFGLNLLGTIFYLRSFAARFKSEEFGAGALMLLLVSQPVFLNLFLGQANLWLTVCLGEFLFARAAGRPYLAGICLAGLLLKPQTLFLIVPALMLKRWNKIFLGLLAASLAIIGLSWLLAGSAAMEQLLQLWLGYVSGLPTNDPQLMMNWRMLGVHLQELTGSVPAAAFVSIGMGITAAASLWPWLKQSAGDGDSLSVAFVGLMAGTALIAWHAHVHMAMVLIPPLMLVAWGRNGCPRWVLHAWVFVPAGLFVLRIILAALTRIGAFSASIYSFLDLLGGIGLFSMNLLLLVWTLRYLQPWRTTPARP